jgi:hypothetical protein
MLKEHLKQHQEMVHLKVDLLRQELFESIMEAIEERNYKVAQKLSRVLNSMDRDEEQECNN